MKKINLYSIILILSISLADCSSNAAGQANPGTDKQQITSAALTNPSGYDAGAKAVPSLQMTIVEGSPIEVKGKSTAFSFHSIDFIDENTGWVVEEKYQSDRQSLQLLMTRDGGRDWEKIGLDNMTLDKVKFVSKTAGWAIARTESKNESGTQIYTMKILHTQDGGNSWEVQWVNKAESAFDLA